MILLCVYYEQNISITFFYFHNYRSDSPSLVYELDSCPILIYCTMQQQQNP